MAVQKLGAPTVGCSGVFGRGNPFTQLQKIWGDAIRSKIPKSPNGPRSTVSSRPPLAKRFQKLSLDSFLSGFYFPPIDLTSYFPSPLARMESPMSGPIPFTDLVAQYKTIQPELNAAVLRVMEEQRFILGDEVLNLESEIAKHCDAKEAIGCASGTDALLLSLMALDLEPGDEVITTPFTFFATAGAIVRAGLKPVFVDIQPDTYNLDPVATAEAISSRTRVIMPVHLFGQCVDMAPLWRLATKHQITIIEDACQAIGAEYNGRRAGVLGRMACFSFFPTKNLGGAGDGGMITTDDFILAKRLRSLRVHGETTQYHHREVGLNSRLDAIQAAILRVKLPHLDQWTAARQRNADRYNEMFRDYGLLDVIIPPAERPGCRHVYNQYSVRVAGGLRDSIQKSLKGSQIGSMIYYPLPLHRQPCFAEHAPPNRLPVAEQTAEEILALPIYAELPLEHQERVVQGIASALGRTQTRRAA